MENQEKQGTCKFCGQTAIIGNAYRKDAPNLSGDEIASYVCECSEGVKWRGAIEEEHRNLLFIEFANGELKDFIKCNDLKKIQARDDYGNCATLVLMEGGNASVTVTTKTVVE